MSFPDLRLNKTYNAKLKLAVNKYTTIKLLIACLEEGRKKKREKKISGIFHSTYTHISKPYLCFLYSNTML